MGEAVHGMRPAPSWRRWFTVAILTICYLFSLIDRQVIMLLIDPIRVSLNLSDVEIALITGFSFSLFYTVMGIPMGWLADRMSRRVLVTAGLIMWSAATALSGLSMSIIHLFLSRTAVAVGEASLSPAAYSIITDSFEPQERTRAGSVYFLGAALGPGLALLIGGGLLHFFSGIPPVRLIGYGALEPWQLVLLSLAVPGLLWALVVFMFLVEPPREEAQTIGAAAGSEEVKIKGELYAALREHRGILIPFFGAVALFSLFGNGLLTWSATYFTRSHGWSLTEAGARLGLAITICGVGGAIFAGWFSSRKVRDMQGGEAILRTILLLCSIILPLSISATLLPNAWLSLLSISLVIFATIGVSSIAPIFVSSLVAGNVRGRAIAIYLLVVGIISVGGGPVIVSVFTEYLFGAPSALGKSIAVLGLLCMPLTTFSFWRALAAYRATTAIQIGSTATPPAR